MDQNIGKIPRASNNNELQKIILLGTVHVLRRFLYINKKTALVSEDQGLAPALAECRKQLIALKTFIIIMIINDNNNNLIMIIIINFINFHYVQN